MRDVPVPRERKMSRTKDIVEPVREIPIHHKPLAPGVARRMPATTFAPRQKRPRNRLKWLLIALSTIVVVGIIGFIASSYYSKASFTIIPRSIPLSVNGTFVAQAPTATSTLSYEVITVKGVASSTISATNGPNITSKAAGKVTLFNSYSNKPVRLVAGTRLSLDGALIYRLTGSVIIPGYADSSGTIVPGKVGASIAADQPGQTYNMARSDASGNLKIVAYQGGPRYDSVYATLLTDVTGGFVGMKKMIDPALVASTTAKLKASLVVSLLSEVKNAIPEGYIMYTNGYTSSFATPVVGGTAQNSATISLDGTVYGIIFKKNDLLAKFSGGQSATAFGDFAYTSPGLETLEITFTNLKDFSPAKKTALVLRIQGNLKMVGTVPVEDITKKLEGISLAGTQSVFKSYSSVIESSTGELVPPWAKIPNNSKRISITVQGQ
jgi:hypothetical protein